jgi:SAM-dependent methyltransferase
MPPDRDLTSAHGRRNRARWDTKSAEYQRRNAPLLDLPFLGWGLWHLPESELQVLGDVRDKTLLELGCGAAQWSIALAREGARPVGLDASMNQLKAARPLMAQNGVTVPLVHADAERLPFRDASFDVVFCDFGAMLFADPYRTVPEAARVLRPGGLFAFTTTTPFAEICWSDQRQQYAETLHRDYFGLHAIDDTADGMTLFLLPYGEWIRLFRRSGFVVEDLIEPRPPADAISTYRNADELAWARRWPMEQLWKVRKAPR